MKQFVIIAAVIGICVLMMLSVCAAAATRDPQYLFFTASRLYEEGDFDEALLTYMSILDNGIESAEVYYNIGNCYFKKNELGNAILFYERARRLAPRDADIRANYAFAQSFIKETNNAYTTLWIKILITYPFKAFSVDETCVIVSLLFVVLISLTAVIAIFRRIQWFYVIPWILALVLFLNGVVTLTEKISRLKSDAIVLSDEVSVRFEPFDRATTHYTVYEGMRVMIVQTKGDWAKIKRPDGKVGWIGRSEIEVI